MEEISKTQQKRNLGNAENREVKENPHMRWVPGVIAGWRKEGPYPRTGAGSLRVKFGPWLTARKKMRISVLHLRRPKFCPKPECSWKHLFSQILKKETAQPTAGF